MVNGIILQTYSVWSLGQWAETALCRIDCVLFFKTWDQCGWCKDPRAWCVEPPLTVRSPLGLSTVPGSPGSFLVW